QNSPVPIATGEHHQGAVELGPLMEARAVSVVQPDLAMMGGLTECLRVAQIAEHYNLVVSPHFLPSLFIHVAAAAPAIRWMEDFPLLEPLFDDPAGMDGDGNIAPPDAPGHGLVWADGARKEFRSAI
ncbi:MAG: enolase C-terminal domain-like protein, partial [Alphaproteobacteria bacterium]